MLARRRRRRQRRCGGGGKSVSGRIVRSFSCSPDPDPCSDDNAGRVAYVSSLSSGDLRGSGIVLEDLSVRFEGYDYVSKIAFRENAKRRPLVLIFPNYAGLKQFDVDVAVFLARCGYCAVAVEMYKDTAEYPRRLRNPSPDSSREDLVAHRAGSFSAMNEWLKSPQAWRKFMSSILARGQKHRAAHPRLAASIGYCFGGQCALEQVRNGDALQGIVSLHGVLSSRPYCEPLDFASKRDLREEERASDENFNSSCAILIENGHLDHYTSSPKARQRFWEEMKERNAQDVRFNDHWQADHGFALAPGVISNKYNQAADRRSTISMLGLFAELWPEYYSRSSIPTKNACGTTLVFSSSKL